MDCLSSLIGSVVELSAHGNSVSLYPYIGGEPGHEGVLLLVDLFLVIFIFGCCSVGWLVNIPLWF